MNSAEISASPAKNSRLPSMHQLSNVGMSNLFVKPPKTKLHFVVGSVGNLTGKWDMGHWTSLLGSLELRPRNISIIALAFNR
jgi:hypothetical protein